MFTVTIIVCSEQLVISNQQYNNSLPGMIKKVLGPIYFLPLHIYTWNVHTDIVLKITDRVSRVLYRLSNIKHKFDQ
jgi:hypothetical protein